MSEPTESSRIIEEAWDAWNDAQTSLARHNGGACTLGDKLLEAAGEAFARRGTICAKNMAREKKRMDEARMTVVWEYGWSFRNSEMVSGGVNLS